MSTLIVLGYKNVDTAKDVYHKVLSLDKDYIVNLQSIAVVTRDAKGKFHVVTPGHEVGASTLWGLFWGVLFGVVLFIPVVGAALGAGVGAIAGAIVKHGVDKDFQEKVRSLLMTDDDSAVFMVIDGATEDKFLTALEPFGGDVLKTSLSFEDEEGLKVMLSEV